MSLGAQFFPYNPRRTRLWLFFAAALCAVAAAFAFARMGDAPLAGVRAGLLLGLLAAFAFLLFRLRPRANWGITLYPLGLDIGRPFSSTPLWLGWGQISAVERSSKHGPLVLRLKEGGRLLIPRVLFADAQAFQRMADSVEERGPAPRHHA